MTRIAPFFLAAACCLLFVCGCESDTSEPNGMNDGSLDATSDSGSPTDTAPDSTPEDAADDSGPADTPSDGKSGDTTDAVSCDQQWQTGTGEQRCCGHAEVSCDLVDFSDNPSASSYDPTNQIFTVKIDRSLAELVDASVSATVTTGQSGGIGGGRFVSETGNFDGETITFDFSDVEFADNEVLQLDSITLEDSCGTSQQLLIDNTVDPHATNETTGFNCEPAPDF